MATPENKIEEFRAESLRVSARLQAPSNFSSALNTEFEESNAAPVRLGELFNVSGSASSQNEREIGLKSGSLDGAGGSGALAAARIVEQHERETAQRKAANDTAMFLDMLQAIADQIRELEDLVDQYDRQLEATNSLIEILEGGGEIDPTDPDHQRLLRLAGIPEEQWGTVTLDDLRQNKIELQTKRDIAKTQLDKKVAEEASLVEAASNIDRGVPVSSSSLATPKAIAEYARRNPDVDLENLTARDLIEIGKINLVSEYAARSEFAELGIDWLKASYAELRLSEGSSDADFEANFRGLIGAMKPDDIALLLQTDQGLDARANTYLANARLNEIVSQYDMDNPDDLMMFEIEMETFDGVWKTALINDPNTDQHIKDLLTSSEQVIDLDVQPGTSN